MNIGISTGSLLGTPAIDNSKGFKTFTCITEPGAVVDLLIGLRGYELMTGLDLVEPCLNLGFGFADPDPLAERPNMVDHMVQARMKAGIGIPNLTDAPAIAQLLIEDEGCPPADNETKEFLIYLVDKFWEFDNWVSGAPFTFGDAEYTLVEYDTYIRVVLEALTAEALDPALYDDNTNDEFLYWFMGTVKDEYADKGLDLPLVAVAG